MLQNRTEITSVGDRCVFQSEVLFTLGSADIGAEGQAQLNDRAMALKELTDQIPDDIEWILQIDGHTDDLPIKTNLYRDNWDLSTARALSVLRYLVEQGIDPQRLAATGYGEFLPIDPGQHDVARARNHRLDFQLPRLLAKGQPP